jgi:Cdc6-like AAA superfamily ATPase
MRLTYLSVWQQVSDTQKVLFHPYSRQQMASILQQQVERLPGPVFEPMALTLCAAKVAGSAHILLFEKWHTQI